MFDRKLEMEIGNGVFIIGLPSTLKSMWNFMCYVFSLFLYSPHFSVQFAPLDFLEAIDRFIGHWKPSLVLLMESEFSLNLIMFATTNRERGECLHCYFGA
jgi:hypothetical protein